MLQIPKELWYPALESVEVKTKPLGVERFGLRLVFWRTADGLPCASIDRCPHLGTALSAGKASKDRLICPFHGFEFDTDGQCRHIPAIGRKGKIPKGIKLHTFPLREDYGFIWLWLGEPREQYPDLPYFKQLKEGWRYRTAVIDWPVHYSRAIENQLDVAHLPFVHRTTIGAGGRSLVEGPYIEANKEGIKVWITNARDDGQTPRDQIELANEAEGNELGLHFLFPNLWIINLDTKLKNFLAFVPINEHKTRYYLRVYHRIHFPIIAELFGWLMILSNRIILNQDKSVVMLQTPINNKDAKLDQFIGADRAIIQFRKINAELIQDDDFTFPH